MKVRFGAFVADLASRELYSGGHRVKLEDKPFRSLAELVRTPGELVTKDRLYRQMWKEEVEFVDYVGGLKTAMTKIRRALHDSPDHPMYVETLPRRGYRFIASVEGTYECLVKMTPVER